MKPQYIIFLIVLLVIIYLVYPSDRTEVQDARERIEQRQEQNNIVEADGWEDENIESQDQMEQSDWIDIWDTSEQQPEQDISNLPTPSVEMSDISDIETPSFVEFGDPVATSDSSFVYNQVRGLEIYREQIEEDLTCDDLTEFLTDRLSAWYFWNTCRFIDWERWLKFNVLRLDWDKYIYERHYIDRQASIYAVLELEQWEWIEQDMLPEKNTEFRDREFPLIEVWDNLMRELIRVN